MTRPASRVHQCQASGLACLLYRINLSHGHQQDHSSCLTPAGEFSMLLNDGHGAQDASTFTLQPEAAQDHLKS